MLATGGGAAGLGIVALVALHDPAPPLSGFAVVGGGGNAPAPAPTDPLAAELSRCRSIPAGTDDPACREAWEVTRRRFVGESRSYVPPTATDAGEGR